MSQPAHKIRCGAPQVTIWRNHGEKGNWYSVIPSRGYRKEETWKETDSLGFDDLLTMCKLLDLAHTWIMHQQAADAIRDISRFWTGVTPQARPTDRPQRHYWPIGQNRLLLWNLHFLHPEIRLNEYKSEY